MNINYIKDKGRKLHYYGIDPKRITIEAREKFNKNAKQDYFGASPNLFVGRFGYPNINVGILNTEEYNENDEPFLWKEKCYSIAKIIDLRTNLINSTFMANINTFDSRLNTKLLNISQEISLAYKPVDIEICLDKKPQISLNVFDDAMPHGAKTKIEKARLTSNPKIPKKVEDVVDDIYFKANDAVNLLYDKGFDEHYLTKVFSLANLGIKNNRKLVPTRWGITAVDDIIGKKIIEEIKDCPAADYLTFFGSYLGNYYLILMFPDAWSYELFEMITIEQDIFATDYESCGGRKNYAESTAGGYYAARFAILEKLRQMKKQAGVLALRFIEPNEYIAPLGVWVVREAARNAMKSNPIEFSSKELMIEYAKKLAKKKFNFNLDNPLKKSKLLSTMSSQSKLSQFL